MLNVFAVIKSTLRQLRLGVALGATRARPAVPPQRAREPLRNMLNLGRRDAEPFNQGWKTTDTGRAAARWRFTATAAAALASGGLVDKRRCQEKALNEAADVRALVDAVSGEADMGPVVRTVTADTKPVGFFRLMRAQALPVWPQASSEARR